MRRNRIGVGIVVLAAALGGPSAAVAAPTAISGPVTTTAIATAVRLSPPAPPAPSPPSTPSSPPLPVASVSTMVRDMLDRMNAERAVRRLAPLRLDDRLVLAAQRHSTDQAARGSVGHLGSDGSTLAVRVDRTGYDWRRLAENVASGHADAAAAMAALMASDGHRRNILSTNVDVGVGLAIGSDGREYWTQVFGTPR